MYIDEYCCMSPSDRFYSCICLMMLFGTDYVSWVELPGFGASHFLIFLIFRVYFLLELNLSISWYKGYLLQHFNNKDFSFMEGLSFGYQVRTVATF